MQPNTRAVNRNGANPERWEQWRSTATFSWGSNVIGYPDPKPPWKPPCCKDVSLEDLKSTEICALAAEVLGPDA